MPPKRSNNAGDTPESKKTKTSPSSAKPHSRASARTVSEGPTDDEASVKEATAESTSDPNVPKNAETTGKDALPGQESGTDEVPENADDEGETSDKSKADADDGAAKPKGKEAAKKAKDWGFDAALNKRIDTFINYADADDHIYCPTRFPKGLMFCQVNDPPRNKMIALVVMPQRTAVTGWIVGTVSTTFMKGADDGWPRSVSIGIEPINPADTDACNALVTEYSTYVKPKEEVDDKTVHAAFRASSFQGYKVAGESYQTNKEFTNIFDAREVFSTSMDEMERLSHEDIDTGDLVLIEYRVSRYDPSKGASSSSPSKSSPFDKGKLLAAFNLVNICLLAKGAAEKKSKGKKKI